ncbi:MAG: AGE family epimerase/isomerase, partial [Bacteroidales bacterium]
KRTALRLVDITLEKGLDRDGSLFNEQEGSHIDKNKHWWQQAEAMVGVWDAYTITKSDVYLEYLEDFWNFIKEHLIDEERGEWHWRVDENNKPITNEDRAGFWKCPYHNSRALMEIINQIKTIDVKHQTLDNGILV